LTRYYTPAGGDSTLLDLNASATSVGGAPLLLRLAARLGSGSLQAPASGLVPLTNTLVMDVEASTVDFKAGTLTSAWRVVPEYPGTDPLTLSLDVYQKPFGKHPDGHLGTWSLPLPAGGDGRRFTITLNPVAKTATATLNGGGAQVFAWTGPPHSDEFTATLNLYAGDRLLKQVPAYEFTLKADKLVDFKPAPGALVVLPFASP
jgi:hypothetical protein